MQDKNPTGLSEPSGILCDDTAPIPYDDQNEPTTVTTVQCQPTHTVAFHFQWLASLSSNGVRDIWKLIMVLNSLVQVWKAKPKASPPHSGPPGVRTVAK